VRQARTKAAAFNRALPGLVIGRFGLILKNLVTPASSRFQGAVFLPGITYPVPASLVGYGQTGGVTAVPALSLERRGIFSKNDLEGLTLPIFLI
jgi:hypothetical protein